MTPKKFKDIRKKLKISQTELAELLKTQTGTGSRQLIAKIEKGETPVQQYIAGVMSSFDKFGLPVEGCRNTEDNQESYDLGVLNNTVHNVLEMEPGEDLSKDEYIKLLRETLKDCLNEIEK